MENKEALQKTFDLLSYGPQRWTKETYARDKQGFVVPVNAGGLAACWCLHGALKKICYDGDIGHTQQMEIVAIIAKEIDPNFEQFCRVSYSVVHEWNDLDTTTYEDVIALLRRCVEKA